MSGERAKTKIEFTYGTSSWEQPIQRNTARAYARKSTALLEKFKGRIDQVHAPSHGFKNWLTTHWLDWKVEYTASRLMRTILHAPDREAAVGLLNTCRANIGHMPASDLRDALYIYTDLAANRVEDRFAEAA